MEKGNKPLTAEELKEIRHKIIKKHIETSDNEDDSISIFFEYHNAMIEYAEFIANQHKPVVSDERFFWDCLNDINAIMWEGFMIKDKGFKKSDGFKIMEILVKWAQKEIPNKGLSLQRDKCEHDWIFDENRKGDVCKKCGETD